MRARRRGHHVTVRRVAMLFPQVFLAFLMLPPSQARHIDSTGAVRDTQALPRSTEGVVTSIAKSWSNMMNGYQKSNPALLFPDDLVLVMKSHSEDSVVQNLSSTPESNEMPAVHLNGLEVLQFLEHELQEDVINPEDLDGDEVEVFTDDETEQSDVSHSMRYPRDVHVDGAPDQATTQNTPAEVSTIPATTDSSPQRTLHTDHHRVTSQEHMSSTNILAEPYNQDGSVQSPVVEALQDAPKVQVVEPNHLTSTSTPFPLVSGISDSGPFVVDLFQAKEPSGSVDGLADYPGLTRIIMKYPIRIGDSTSEEDFDERNQRAEGRLQFSFGNPTKEDITTGSIFKASNSTDLEKVGTNMSSGVGSSTHSDEGSTISSPSPTNTTSNTSGVDNVAEETLLPVTFSSTPWSLSEESNDDPELIVDPLNKHFEAVELPPASFKANQMVQNLVFGDIKSEKDWSPITLSMEIDDNLPFDITTVSTRDHHQGDIKMLRNYTPNVTEKGIEAKPFESKKFDDIDSNNSAVNSSLPSSLSKSPNTKDVIGDADKAVNNNAYATERALSKPHIFHVSDTYNVQDDEVAQDLPQDLSRLPSVNYTVSDIADKRMIVKAKTVTNDKGPRNVVSDLAEKEREEKRTLQDFRDRAKINSNVLREPGFSLHPNRDKTVEQLDRHSAPRSVHNHPPERPSRKRVQSHQKVIVEPPNVPQMHRSDLIPGRHLPLELDRQRDYSAVAMPDAHYGRQHMAGSQKHPERGHEMLQYAEQPMQYGESERMLAEEGNNGMPPYAYYKPARMFTRTDTNNKPQRPQPEVSFHHRRYQPQQKQVLMPAGLQYASEQDINVQPHGYMVLGYPEHSEPESRLIENGYSERLDPERKYFEEEQYPLHHQEYRIPIQRNIVEDSTVPKYLIKKRKKPANAQFIEQTSFEGQTSQPSQQEKSSLKFMKSTENISTPRKYKKKANAMSDERYVAEERHNEVALNSDFTQSNTENQQMPLAKEYRLDQETFYAKNMRSHPTPSPFLLSAMQETIIPHVPAAYWAPTTTTEPSSIPVRPTTPYSAHSTDINNQAEVEKSVTTDKTEVKLSDTTAEVGYGSFGNLHTVDSEKNGNENDSSGHTKELLDDNSTGSSSFISLESTTCKSESERKSPPSQIELLSKAPVIKKAFQLPSTQIEYTASDELSHAEHTTKPTLALLTSAAEQDADQERNPYSLMEATSTLSTLDGSEAMENPDNDHTTKSTLALLTCAAEPDVNRNRNPLSMMDATLDGSLEAMEYPVNDHTTEPTLALLTCAAEPDMNKKRHPLTLIDATSTLPTLTGPLEAMEYPVNHDSVVLEISTTMPSPTKKQSKKQKKKKKKKVWKIPFLEQTTTPVPWPQSLASLAPFIPVPDLTDFVLATPAPPPHRRPGFALPPLPSLWDPSNLNQPAYSFEVPTLPPLPPSFEFRRWDSPTLRRPIGRVSSKPQFQPPWTNYYRRRRSVEPNDQAEVSMEPLDELPITHDSPINQQVVPETELAVLGDLTAAAQDPDEDSGSRVDRSCACAAIPDAACGCVEEGKPKVETELEPLQQVDDVMGLGLGLPLPNLRPGLGRRLGHRTAPALPPALEELLPRTADSEADRAEREHKAVQRMIQLVNVLGSLQSFVADRAKTIVRRLNRIVDDEECELKRDGRGCPELRADQDPLGDGAGQLIV